MRDIETFLEVARELHFGRAARSLGLTQGRVSQIIRGLEREVGAQLFERSGRSVRLTPLGERFRAGAVHGHRALAEVLKSCQAAARHVTGQIRLGYLRSVGADLVDRVVRAFDARHPDCEIMVNTLVCRDLRSLTELFESWDVDVAIAWSPGTDDSNPHTDLVSGPVLAEVPRGVLVPAGHSLAQIGAVSIEELVDHELLRFPDSFDTSLRKAWTPDSTPLGRALTYAERDVCQMIGRREVQPEDVAALVARGYGLHLTTVSLFDRVLFPGLAKVHVHDLPPMPVVPLWSAAAETATIRAFVEVAAALSRRRDPAVGIGRSFQVHDPVHAAHGQREGGGGP